MGYHYCSVATFLNIIKNRTLRMLNITVRRNRQSD